MEKVRFTYRPPKKLWEEITKEAEQDGISLNQFLNLKLKKDKKK